MIRLLCGDQVRQVDLQESGETLRVSVDGSAFAVEVEEVAPRTFVLRQGDRVETFHCAREGDTIHLFWRGAAYVLEEEGERSRAAHRQVSTGLEAPMPGRVIAVKVLPGQEVAKGEEILVVESMKMENALRAPRPGKVKALTAKVGDMVSPGVVLVELE